MKNDSNKKDKNNDNKKKKDNKGKNQKGQGSGKNKPGKKLQGNDRPLKNIQDMEVELLNGFPLEVENVKNYRNAIKEICAQALSVGIKNYYNNDRKKFDFNSFLSKYINETNQEKELRQFYNCFYLYYYKDVEISYLANISHYKSNKKKIVSRALKDIRVILNEHLLKVYNKLFEEYELYEYEKYDNPNGELKTRIEKLKYCYDAISKICDVYNFLFCCSIPKYISKKTYVKLDSTNCKINAFYKLDDNKKYARIQRRKHIDLGYDGALYFLKKRYGVLGDEYNEQH